MHAAYLAQTPVLSPKTINAVRKKYTNLAIGDVDNTGFRTILNPFNFVQGAEPGAVSASVLAPVLSDRAKPEYLKIPEFVEGVQTLEFMGFDNRTAILIWHKYRNGPPRPKVEDLLWCAMQYLTYVEGQATRDGIYDQRTIKELMGFHYGETLFRIDTEIPVTPVTLLGPRVLFWTIPIISRRYRFIYDLEGSLADSRLSGWSARTEARTMNYEIQALREGVGSWFHYILDTAMAVEPTANEPANMPLDEKAANLAFEFVNGLDDTPIQEVAPSNMPLHEEAAITPFEFFNGLDGTPIQMKGISATERDDSLPEDKTVRKEPVLIKAYLNGYQLDKRDCGIVR